MDVFVRSTTGKVNATESYAQGIVKMKPLVEIYRLCDFNYMLKAKMLQFLFNAYIETEIEYTDDTMYIFDMIFMVIDEIKDFIESYQRDSSDKFKYNYF